MSGDPILTFVSLLSVIPHAALHITLGVLLGDGLTLVIVFLTATEANLQLGPAVLVDIELKGHQGHALEGQLARKLTDLLLVQKQLAVAQRIHVKSVPLLVRGNVHAHDYGFAVTNADVGFLDGNLALTDGLDLRARQDDARLVGLFHEVVVVGFFVVGLKFDLFFHRVKECRPQAAPLTFS